MYQPAHSFLFLLLITDIWSCPTCLIDHLSKQSKPVGLHWTWKQKQNTSCGCKQVAPMQRFTHNPEVSTVIKLLRTAFHITKKKKKRKNCGAESGKFSAADWDIDLFIHQLGNKNRCSPFFSHFHHLKSLLSVALVLPAAVFLQNGCTKWFSRLFLFLAEWPLI